jgi:hypothetical protein
LHKNSIKFLGTFSDIARTENRVYTCLIRKGCEAMEYLNEISIEILQLCNDELQLELVINNGMITDCQFGKE